MRTSDFDYEIPRELVAQEPITPRDSSRLMVIGKDTGQLLHTSFRELPHFLEKGDVLVFNDSKVIPARLRYTRGLDDEIVILLLNKKEKNLWEIMMEVGEVEVGEELRFTGELYGKITGLGNFIGKRKERLGLIEFSDEDKLLETKGEAPLPPYIHSYKGDPNRYQTVYAKVMGSAAAPTAGFHFTEQLLDRLRQRGIGLAFVTLHVSIDTFMPVYEDNPEEHKIHKEFISVSKENADFINNRKGRLICVGTTSTRVVEQVSSLNHGSMASFEDWANIYILPGYKFHIDGMITNFHYPRSTNIMMIAAFVGWDKLKKAYEEAIEMKYRLYSFGDSMLIL